jgi:predicted dehydrogenase
MKRRDFLKITAASAPLLISAEALGRTGPGANGIVNVGLIGLGGRCREIARSCFPIPEMRIVAICDCFKPRVDSFMEMQPEGEKWTGYTDFREMIEKENLDGVMVETTTHARAWVTCHAMAMGMDAYIEKPMCLTIDEGRQMVKSARRYDRVTQIGTQQRSMPLNIWASDLVKNGTLGRVHTVLAPNFTGPWRWTPRPGEDMPEGGSDTWWDTWTNQAEMRPYRRDIHRGWNRWWDYDSGGQSFGVTGWGTHSYDQVQRGLGTDDTGPVEIVLEEAYREEVAGRFEEREPDANETGAPYYGMVRGHKGFRAKVRMRYKDGTELRLHMDADNGPGLGCRFIGDNGFIEVNRDRISASDEGLINGPDRPPSLSVIETQPHIENWVECIKTRERCTADIEIGQRATTICYLVNIVRDVGMVGKRLKWNPRSERFTNCDEGNKMRSRERREGYELPRRGLFG